MSSSMAVDVSILSDDLSHHLILDVTSHHERFLRLGESWVLLQYLWP